VTERSLAEWAVRASGVAPEEVCRRARVSRRYLGRLLREGAPYDTAVRLAAAVRCPVDVFLKPRAASSGPGRARAGAAVLSQAPLPRRDAGR